MEPQKFSLRSRIKSFSFALAGIRSFIIGEHNARIHLLGTIAVIVVAWFLHVSLTEASALTIVTGLVWITELLNTAVERLADLVTRERDPNIKIIKDLAAGAVLIAAITAVIVGLFIFIPRII
jgi:diacylglycerol kinase (ATP)